jgi:mannan endo-1,4-beta-mannosidase
VGGEQVRQDLGALTRITGLVWLLCVLVASAHGATPSSAPANRRANAQARALLHYFHRLPARPDRRVVSGQFTDVGHDASGALMKTIHDQTGHWPALLGTDYGDFVTGSLRVREPNRAAIEYWRQGGLVTVSAHLYNPANPQGFGLRDPGVNLDDLLKPGSATHRRWMQELDLLAAGLQELKQAGVVVLWRPFHEMNGDWFWWGGKDPAPFVRVWRHMFDDFSRTRGLDNLLWVYAPNQGSNTARYYPGNGYVDLVGLDAYTDFIDRQHIRGYDELAALPKPFGFAEYGPHDAEHPPGDYDYRRFIEGLVKHFPKTTFFMAWNTNWSLARNHHARALLEHPWVITRAHLPPGLVTSPRRRSGQLP